MINNRAECLYEALPASNGMETSRSPIAVMLFLELIELGVDYDDEKNLFFGAGY